MSKLARAIQICLIVTVMLGCMKQPARPHQLSYFTHRISYPGETLALISSWYAGSANNWQSVAAVNPGLDPRKLRMGMIVNIPEYMVVRRDMLPKKLVGSASRKVPTTEVVENSDPDISNAIVIDQEVADRAEEAASQAAKEAAHQAAESNSDLVEEKVEEASVPTESAAFEEPAAAPVDELSAPATIESESVTVPADIKQVVEAAAIPAATPAAETKAGNVKSRDELWKELLEE